MGLSYEARVVMRKLAHQWQPCPECAACRSLGPRPTDPRILVHGQQHCDSCGDTGCPNNDEGERDA